MPKNAKKWQRTAIRKFEVAALGVITISRGYFERCCSNKKTPPYHSNLSFVTLRTRRPTLLHAPAYRTPSEASPRRRCGHASRFLWGSNNRIVAVIMVLSQATSALDSASERVVQAALDAIMAKEKRTTVAIAHRLSTIRQADKIAVVDGGKVIEQGTYDELLLEDGGFAKLVAAQQ